MEFFLKGILAGFIIAVPLGPVAVLCFHRVLTERRLVGLAAVVGAATADALYGLLAAVGLRTATILVEIHHTLLRVVGGLVIIALGAFIFRSHPAARKKASESAASLVAVYFSTLGLMLANPTVLISLVALFAALDLGQGPPRLDAVWVAAGVFLGSAAWWLVYRLIAVKVTSDMEAGTLRTINRVSGGLICAFGFWELLSPLIFNR